MGNSVLIKLQAEDNLTPTLRQNRDELARLFSSIRELDAVLRTMRANRAGIISGDIRSDIAEIARLQDELQRVRAAGNRSDIRRAEAELRRALATETNNLTAALREQRDEYQRLSIVTSRSYEHYRRQQTAAQRAAEATDRDTQSLRSNNAVRNSSINSLVRHIRQVETLVVSVYGLKRAYDVLLGSGISLHRQIESQTAGIAALITANTRLASGSKDLAKHFKIASQTAEQTMKKIKTASVETAATFPELTAIFQQAVGGALGAGKAMGDTIEKQIDNTITLAKRMSNIASAIGMPMAQVNEEIRSIIEGTTDINSRIAKMIGITNEEIRKAKAEKDGLVKYLNEKLKPFDALADIQSFDRMVARIKDSIDNIKLDATDEAFKQIKLHLKDLNDWMSANKGEIAQNIASGIKNTADAIKSAVVFVKEWKDEILLLAKAFVIFKAGGWVVGGIESLITNFRRASETLGLVTTSAAGATRAINILKTALFALRGALAGLAIYGAIELFTRLNKKAKENKIDFEKLNAVLEKTNEEIAKMSAPELSRDENTLTDARKKIANQIYDAYRRIQEVKQEGGIGSEDMIGFYEKNLDALAAKLKQIDDQLKNVKDSKKEATEAEKKYNQTIKEQKEYLEAVSKLTPDMQKLLEKYGKEFYDSKAEENLANVRKQIEGVKKALLEVSDPQVMAGLINVFKYLRNVEDGLEQKAIDDKKAAKEKAANEAKQAHAEAMRRAKEKADWQIKHAKAVGDTEKALRLELQQYEKELQELISKGYITREQKADFLRQKEKEYHEKKLKEQKELDESFEKEFDDRQNAQKEFYAAIGDYQKAAVVAAELELKKLVELAQKAGVVIDKDLAEKLKKIAEENAKKGFEKFNKEAKKSFKDIKNSWADTVSSMSKTVDDGFFNFFIGKTKSLKKALKDIGTNLMRDFISPYARTLSQGLAGGFGALLGGGSNLAQIATDLGLSKADNGGWVGTIGNTAVELSSRGEIVKGAGAIDQSTQKLLGSISNLKTAYDAFTGSITSGFAKAGGYLANAGFGGAGAFTQGIGAGIGNLFGAGSVPVGMTQGITSGMGGSYLGAGTAQYGVMSSSPYYTAGAGLGGGLVGGAVGYGIGTGLDKAFGAQTYAPYTGAAAGAAVGGYAAIAGSLSAVPVWGWIAAAVVLAIGGMIGKSKITDWGYQVGQDLSLGLDKGLDGGVNNWKEKTKKSWFSKSVSNQTSPIDEQTQKMLNQYVRTNSVLLKEFTGGDFKLPARTYNKRTLIDEGFGGALIAGVMGKNYDKALSFGGNEGELEKTYRYWMEQAKQDKKETYDLLAEYVGKINSNIKNLKLESLNNSLEKMKFANDEALDALKTLNSGLGAFSNDIDHVGKDMAGQIEKAYREALKNDFSKETVQRYEALTEAYKKAKQAQDEYTKALISFTQSVASTQGGFYQALGFDTNFLTLQNIYTRLRNIAGALESDLDDKEKSDVAKIGSSNDPRVWAKYFHDMGSAKLQEFLSTGNVEMRAELVKLAAEYRTFTASNGGRDVWLKSFSDIEEITKQITALKLAEAAQNTLNLQREQLNLLNKQKSVLEKIAQTAQKLRDSVIDSSTSELNYRFALERARIAYNAKDYDSTAYENLNTAVAKQEQYLKQTAGSYAEYKLSILKMASEIEGITGAASLDDINRQIKRLEGLLNSSSNSQLSALEAQKEALIKGANDQINAMELLLGSDSPIVKYLKETLSSLKEGKAVPNYAGAIANVNNGAVTANGAVLSSQLDRDINAIYKDVLGRSVEQGGLDAWKRKALMENLSLSQIREQIIRTATAITGSSNKNDWIEWSKRQGLKPYAEGGIVTRPTRALIGEAGAEAVIPLKNGAVRAQIVGVGDNGEQTRLMREFVSVGKELLKYAKDSATIQKDTTNGQAVVVTIDNLEQILRKVANQ